MREPDTTTKGMSPAECVIDVFGGIREAARAIEIEASTVMRWKRRPQGRIPHEHMAPLIEAARARGLRLTLQEVVWGRPGIHRTIISFDTPEPPSPLGAMARMLTACA